MKILHTSDWHLGRTLHGVDMLEHQAAFLAHLAGVVRERGIDLVVVAGDVYDRAIPPVAAVALLERALTELCAITTVVLSSGNHDSAVRLGFAASLFHPCLSIATSIARLDSPFLVADEYGPVAVYAIPYLEPDVARSLLSDDRERLGPDARKAGGPPTLLARSHEAVLGRALENVRADSQRRRVAQPALRTVVLAHAFVVGSSPSESERDLRVGGVDSVSASLFDGFDYVALGHLHGAQNVRLDVDGRPRVRYSGSPLAYSFSERDQLKSTTLVELDASGVVRVEVIPAPVPRRLRDVRGSLDELLGVSFDDAVGDWVRVVVTDDERPDDLYARVSARFPFALAVQYEPPRGFDQEGAPEISAALGPVEVTEEFVRHVLGREARAAESAVVLAAFDRVRSAEASS